MAVRNLFSFTSLKGYTYDVKYNTDTQTPFVDTNAPGTAIEYSVTIGEMGSNQGQVFYTECVGTTLLKVIGRQIYPFAVVSRTPNSASCGYIPGTPTPCNFVKTVLPINETFAGAKDGAVTLDISLPGQTLLYSLNNINFQTNKVFSNLAPGTYNWYAKSSVGACKANGQFVIAAGAPRSDIVFPWQDKFCHLFQIIRNDVTYKISEPIKWDAVNIKGKRDPEWHGWKDQYSDEVIELEFDCDAGRDVLQAEYDLNGSDGSVKFQYGITYKGTDYIFFDGKINFNTFKAYPQKVSASVESVNYNPIIQTRLETKVAMNAVKSIDGIALAAPPVISFPLHSKAISNSFTVNSSTTVDLPAEKLDQDARWFVLPDTNTIGADDIQDSFLYSLQRNLDAPYDVALYQFKMKFGGTYTFDIRYTLNLKYRLNVSTGTLTVRNYFMINDQKTQVGATSTYPLAAGPFVFTPVSYSYQGTITLKADDEIYFFTQLDFSLVRKPLEDPTKYQLDINQSSVIISVTSLEQASGSTCKGWFLSDAINHIIKSITNGHNYLKSSFLGLKGSQQASDGGGSLYITTNGKQIRNFDPANNPLIISLKDLLDSSRALFCVGYGFEMVAGVEVMRIERVNYFYQNKELLVIDECWDLHTDTAKELLYNEYEIGYEKYQDEGSNTLDEFNTKQEGTTPLLSNKLKIQLKSKLIGSGYALEGSRRQQFADTPTDSYQNDEDGFIIAMRRINAGGVIYDTFQPERVEPYAQVSGVLSPSTSYNLRISPARMLRNWAVWLRNAFHYKPDTATIQPTFVAQNGALTTRFLPTEPRPIGDINKDLITEKATFDLTDYPVEERLYRPEWIYFKARLTPDKVQLINKAMKGGADASKNYGYIAVKDDNGLYQAGFIYELDYNFSTEVASIRMLKKFGNPVTPGEECCKYLVINGCRTLVNGQKLIL
jgi:calcineurin-like phosphoesterase family protein